jgi:hypothetical protein
MHLYNMTTTLLQKVAGSTQKLHEMEKLLTEKFQGFMYCMECSNVEWNCLQRENSNWASLLCMQYCQSQGAHTRK